MVNMSHISHTCSLNRGFCESMIQWWIGIGNGRVKSSADIIMVGSYKTYGKDELQGLWLCWFSEHV